MKYIYTWHEDTQLYTVRVATEQEENRIKTAITLLKQCKTVHDSIIQDADTLYHGDIERFIDDEAYYVVKQLHHNLSLIDEFTKGLIKLDTGKYYFLFW